MNEITQIAQIGIRCIKQKFKMIYYIVSIKLIYNLVAGRTFQ